MGDMTRDEFQTRCYKLARSADLARELAAEYARKVTELTELGTCCFDCGWQAIENYCDCPARVMIEVGRAIKAHDDGYARMSAFRAEFLDAVERAYPDMMDETKQKLCVIIFAAFAGRGVVPSPELLPRFRFSSDGVVTYNSPDNDADDADDDAASGEQIAEAMNEARGATFH